jgi:hypothetical protein
MPIHQIVNLLANSQAGAISHLSSFGPRGRFIGSCRAKIHLVASVMKGFIPPTESTGAVTKLFGSEVFVN